MLTGGGKTCIYLITPQLGLLKALNVKIINTTVPF